MGAVGLGGEEVWSEEVDSGYNWETKGLRGSHLSSLFCQLLTDFIHDPETSYHHSSVYTRKQIYGLGVQSKIKMRKVGWITG